MRGAWTVAGDCDLLLFLVDAARELQRPDPRIHRLLADSCAAAALGLPASWEPPPAVLVLNKCDLVPREARSQLLPLTDRLKGLRGFEDVFYVSAKDGERRITELLLLPAFRRQRCDSCRPCRLACSLARAPPSLPHNEQAAACPSCGSTCWSGRRRGSGRWKRA